jgi:DNA-binding transcriptional LysR family regulator
MSKDRTSTEEALSTATRRLKSGQITLQKLQIFCSVVELGSVTRAAERMNVAQPAVTAHLRSLEDKLGATLLQRSGRSLVLTEAGERAYRWAGEMVARSFELERELGGLSDGAAGSAVIASTMAAGSYILTDIVIAFSKQTPGAHVALQISNPRMALDAVRTGACDFAIIILDPSQDVEDLTVKRLWDEPLVLCAGMSDGRVGPVATNAMLGELDYVTPPRGLVTRDLEDEMLRVHGVTHRNIILELGHPESLKRAVRAGVGVSFLPTSTVQDDFAAGQLRRVETPDLENFRIPVFLVHRRRKVLSSLQHRLLDHIVASRPREFLRG